MSDYIAKAELGVSVRQSNLRKRISTRQTGHGPRATVNDDRQLL